MIKYLKNTSKTTWKTLKTTLQSRGTLWEAAVLGEKTTLLYNLHSIGTFWEPGVLGRESLNPFSTSPVFGQVQKFFFRKFIASLVFMLERYVKRPFF